MNVDIGHFGKVWYGQQYVTCWIELNILWHYDCCILAGLERHYKRICYCCEQRLPLSWTEEAAPWILQRLGLLVFHTACVVLGIALCWCWQCLLAVGGNLLPHIVTPLDDTTVAWCCRETQDVLHPAECQPGPLQTSQWPWKAHVFTTWHCKGRYNSLFTEDKCLQHNMSLWFGCWTGYNQQLCQMMFCIILVKLKSPVDRAAYRSGS